MPPDLYIELWEHVIDYMHDDVRVLLTCALTCRAWLPRSRCHLYRSVDIYHNATLYRFAETLSNAPHLGNLVEELQIHENRNELKDPFPLFPEVLSAKLNRLQNIVMIGATKASRVYFGLYNESFALLPQFTTVTSLTVDRVRFDSVDALGQFISSFPSLSHLRMYNVRAHGIDPFTFKPQRPIALQTIFLSDVPHEVLPWIAHNTEWVSLVSFL
ncbi:hypothetical protein OBBRIDRAFT_34336 [Obba rivulosa]|uniref:F-box domain-containing protein n=1 Tax=Obba rivulosa TaxID=1052685 RepID=A0A8E2DJD2_9APHY|nr:hypothetical protein OBBRIDRAFT_34336 [Obba rivulosa]